MTPLRVSVVIPVRNEAEHLADLFDSVFGQSSPPDEVVIVDAGSTDGTREALEARAATEPRLRVIVEPGALPGHGRNVAIAAASGDVIVQIDGGCRVAPQWLENLVAPILEDRADYTYGHIAPMPVPRRFLGRNFDMAQVISCCVHHIERAPGLIAGGASVAYRRAVWERAGRFPDWLRCGEDVLFARNVESMPDLRRHYAADSVAYWQVGPGLRQVFGRKVRYTTADALLERRMRTVRKLAARTAAGLALLATSCWWPWALAVLAVGVLGVWAKAVRGAIRRYRIRIRPEEQLDAPRLLPLAAATELVIMTAEEIGMLKGIVRRIRESDLPVRAEAYRRAFEAREAARKPEQKP